MLILSKRHHFLLYLECRSGWGFSYSATSFHSCQLGRHRCLSYDFIPTPFYLRSFLFALLSLSYLESLPFHRHFVFLTWTACLFSKTKQLTNQPSQPTFDSDVTQLYNFFYFSANTLQLLFGNCGLQVKPIAFWRTALAKNKPWSIWVFNSKKSVVKTPSAHSGALPYARQQSGWYRVTSESKQQWRSQTKALPFEVFIVLPLL